MFQYINRIRIFGARLLRNLSKKGIISVIQQVNSPELSMQRRFSIDFFLCRIYVFQFIDGKGEIDFSK